MLTLILETFKYLLQPQGEREQGISQRKLFALNSMRLIDHEGCAD